MNTLRVETQVGRKNILFGVFLFLLFAFGIGVPLTLNFFGVPVLSVEQYQLWKVVHGYGLFLGVINCLLGTSMSQLRLTGRQKEAMSWSFIIAGLFGAIVRMALVLLAVYDEWHLLPSLGEAVFFSVGLAIFVYGWRRFDQTVLETVAKESAHSSEYALEDQQVRTKA